MKKRKKKRRKEEVHTYFNMGCILLCKHTEKGVKLRGKNGRKTERKQEPKGGSSTTQWGVLQVLLLILFIRAAHKRIA